MKTLTPIPAGVAIAEKDGSITAFFRLAWESLRASFQLTPNVAALSKTGQHASIGTTTVFAALLEGLYRISFYVRVTTPDGVSSSVSVTLGWVDGGVSVTATSAAVTGDTTASAATGTLLVHADAGASLTVATTYASNTPGAMQYRLETLCEQVAA